MAGKGPGIYFNRKTREVVSINGGQGDFDLSGWARVSDDPTLRLLAVRELLLAKGLIRNDRAVYWSGFRGSAPGGDDSSAVGVTFSIPAQPQTDLKPSHHRPGGLLSPILTAMQVLLRFVFGPRAAS